MLLKKKFLQNKIKKKIAVKQISTKPVNKCQQYKSITHTYTYYITSITTSIIQNADAQFSHEIKYSK